ncbi:MAG: glycosyltransferase family 39 protein [Acidobacteria bacterium]|nr:glycosyltransferase family 39 protein [Acidobacteriota bacterium]
MDDVDAAQAAIARAMLRTGDWITPRLHGFVYLDKSPLVYWAMAASFAVFGIHDWAARIPVALSAILLCWVTARFTAWAFGRRAGLYAGVALATCAGLFLFTRVQLPDVLLTLCVTVAFWAFLRLLDDDESQPLLWSFLLGASLAGGLLAKGLIAAVTPVGAGLLYLLLTRQLFSPEVWRRLRPWFGFSVFLLLSAPWYVLATLRNPPYFDFTLESQPGHYRGFFWRYFINEHALRFLNRRYPRDYNTVPRLQFWLLHLVWLFPWSVYLPAVARLSFKPVDRAGRARLLALCWAAFLLLFFTFSTTQEYYTMPVYPALALLIGSALAATDDKDKWTRWGTRVAAAIATIGAVACLVILLLVRNIPAVGDISSALTQNPDAYTLSLGHMRDLTLESFAYLRLPLLLAGIALLAGAVGNWRYAAPRAFWALALMMLLFVQAARMALVVFDPYLSSRPLAESLLQAPPGEMIVDHEYYAFSAVFYYADRTGLLLNGRINQVEYGSHAPGAPDVFLNDAGLESLWRSQRRYYLLATGEAVPRFKALLGQEALHPVKESGGKFLFTNHPLN